MTDNAKNDAGWTGSLDRLTEILQNQSDKLIESARTKRNDEIRTNIDILKWQIKGAETSYRKCKRYRHVHEVQQARERLLKELVRANEVIKATNINPPSILERFFSWFRF